MSITIAIAAYGLWYTLGRGKISQAPRDLTIKRFPWFVAMLECPGCFGFWIGLLISGWLFWRDHTTAPAYLLALPFITVATNRLLHGLASFGDRNDHDLAQ
jgi:hypothetical protein